MAGLLRAAGPLIGLLFVYLLFLAIAPDRPVGFLDIRTVAVHAVLVSIVGIGMTLVIVSGGIDLSVGSGVALSGVVAAMASRSGWPLPIVVLAAVGTGAACGAYNGLLAGVLRLPAFIVTLGTLGFFRGVAKWASSSNTVYAPTRGLERLMSPEPPSAWWVLAPGTWIALVLAACGSALLARTVLGRQLVAIGCNRAAARLAGLPIAWRTWQVYTLCGACVGVAGLLQFGRVTVGDPTISVGLELDVVAAVVIGGASLAGGTGSVWATVAGAVMMAFLRNRCTALGWPNFVQEMIVGHIIVIAVAMDFVRRRRE